MDKIKIGIPRAMPYYYYSDIWKYFFEKLGFEVVVSPPTNKGILNNGIDNTYDEMCLSLKVYMGHIDYLKDKCDYLLVPRIESFSIDNQMCTNFFSLYDLVNNIFGVNILNYNIGPERKDNEKNGLMNIALYLGKKRCSINDAYIYAKAKSAKKNKNLINENHKKLSSNKLKVLVVGHSYVVHDEYVGKPIVKNLLKLNTEVIYADRFDPTITNKLSEEFSKTLYWKYNKELIGAIKLVEDYIDGVVFVSAFPCGPDSLVNELVIRKLNLPYLNLVVDDIDSLTGIETRIESFIDILEKYEKVTK